MTKRLRYREMSAGLRLKLNISAVVAVSDTPILATRWCFAARARTARNFRGTPAVTGPSDGWVPMDGRVMTLVSTNSRSSKNALCGECSQDHGRGNRRRESELDNKKAD